MDKDLQRERHHQLKGFLISHSAACISWAEKHRISATSINMLLYEVYSRVQTTKALRKIFPKAVIEQGSGLSRYDIIVHLQDEDLFIESKYKVNDDDEYATDDISFPKFNSILSLPNSYVAIPFWDGVVRIYKADNYTTIGEWTHQSKTADEGDEITENKVVYSPVSASWTTTITTPLC